MSVLMMDGAEASQGDLLLCEADFPSSYVNMKHPGDGILTDVPITPEFIRHHRPHHHRHILRASFKVKNCKYVALSFVCDTGAPGSFYLSPWADRILEEGGRRLEDEAGNTYIRVLDKPAATQETPRTHQPANIMGLSIIEKFRMSVVPNSFSFEVQFKHL